jgi:hypothetical protein
MIRDYDARRAEGVWLRARECWQWRIFTLRRNASRFSETWGYRCKRGQVFERYVGLALIGDGRVPGMRARA